MVHKLLLALLIFTQVSQANATDVIEAAETVAQHVETNGKPVGACTVDMLVQNLEPSAQFQRHFPSYPRPRWRRRIARYLVMAALAGTSVYAGIKGYQYFTALDSDQKAFFYGAATLSLLQMGLTVARKLAANQLEWAGGHFDRAGFAANHGAIAWLFDLEVPEVAGEPETPDLASAISRRRTLRQRISAAAMSEVESALTALELTVIPLLHAGEYDKAAAKLVARILWQSFAAQETTAHTQGAKPDPVVTELFLTVFCAYLFVDMQEIFTKRPEDLATFELAIQRELDQLQAHAKTSVKVYGAGLRIVFEGWLKEAIEKRLGRQWNVKVPGVE